MSDDVIENTLIPVFGHFRDDSTWGDFLAGVEEYRRALIEEETDPERERRRKEMGCDVIARQSHERPPR